MGMEEKWAGWGSALASAMFLWAMVRQYFSGIIGDRLAPYTGKLFSLIYPYMEITFFEYTGERLKRSAPYAAVEAYLAASTSSAQARRFKADSDREGSALVLAVDEHEEVRETFCGAKLYWCCSIIPSKSPSFSFHPSPPDRRFYRLTFHRRHRDLVTKSYLHHVLTQGKAIGLSNRHRRLYTNVSNYNYDYRKRAWSHVPFEHPATFETVAMDPEKKREIIEDLLAFRRSKEFYSRVGKPWKRGYLLYGPPGTGKSTMIAAMANLLDYDVYDLELTAVKDNTALRKLLLEISSKAIIVFEDIDCSLDLSGKRRKNEKEKTEEEKLMGKEEDPKSKVTLSGLLNFIDGLWSACGGERLVVFTTNYVEKLDPALIRRGRMDRHIELSYCDFEGFRVLARNYLGIEEHAMFGEIRVLMEEREISPADVAENLMPKMMTGAAGTVEVCLGSLIKALKVAKVKSAKAEDAADAADAAAAAGESVAAAAAAGESVAAEAKVEEGKEECFTASTSAEDQGD